MREGAELAINSEIGAKALVRETDCKLRVYAVVYIAHIYSLAAASTRAIICLAHAPSSLPLSPFFSRLYCLLSCPTAFSLVASTAFSLVAYWLLSRLYCPLSCRLLVFSCRLLVG